jgi:hypothetical protein
MERQHAEIYVHLIFSLRCDICYVVGDIESIPISYVRNCGMFDSLCVVCECMQGLIRAN